MRMYVDFCSDGLCTVSDRPLTDDEREDVLVSLEFGADLREDEVEAMQGLILLHSFHLNNGLNPTTRSLLETLFSEIFKAGQAKGSSSGDQQ